MNVNEALVNIKGNYNPTTEARVLANEVNRLREQRKLLYDVIPDGASVPLAIWQEIHEEKLKEKQMTVDQAICNIGKFGECVSEEAKTLIHEVKRLREEIKSREEKEKQLLSRQNSNYAQIRSLADEVVQLRKFDIERASIIREKNEEIKCLREQCKRGNERYRKLRDELVLFSREMNRVLNEFV